MQICLPKSLHPLVAIVVTFLFSLPVLSQAPADAVYVGGRVYTENPQQPWASAMAVKDRQLVFVGTDQDVAKYVGEHTRRVDLRGKFVIPGFVEGHIHPMNAWTAAGVDLQTDDPEELLRRVKKYADEHPEQKVIRGFGWRYNVYGTEGPRKEDLDRIVSDRPVYLLAIDDHCAWVNSKALELAGVRKGTPDPQPPYSIYKKDARGEPTGYLIEPPAEVKVMSAIQPVDFQLIRDGLTKFLPKLSEAGVTTVMDAGIGAMPQEDGFALYQQLEQEGQLPVRVTGVYYWNDPGVDPLPKLRALHERFHSELVRVDTLKINGDGGDYQYTAAMLQPYTGKPGSSGLMIFPAQQMKKAIAQAHAEGLSTMCHCYGDLTNRTYLDGVEAARKAVPTSASHHTMSHAFFLADAEIPRFKVLNVTAQFSTQWATPDASNLSVSMHTVGKKIVETEMMRVGEVQRTGARLALGSDWPAASYYSTYRPLEEIQVAATREMLFGKGLLPSLPPANETITVAEALQAATVGAAYVTGMQEFIGTLQVGKMADFTVLDENLLEIDPHQISKVPVLLTVMNGRATYRAAAWQ